MDNDKCPPGVARDARLVASGMYRMNARSADRYGFCADADGREVGYGEFLFPGELEDQVDWVLVLKDNTIRRSSSG